MPQNSNKEQKDKDNREHKNTGSTNQESLEAYKLIRRIKLKQPQSRFLVLILTDGKANVDTEKKNLMSMNLALSLSVWFGARYFILEDLKAETVFQFIKSPLGYLKFVLK
ncbi:MAG: hypothetical protein ABDH19_04710 [Thermodesulfovibrio sp.]